MLKKNDSLLLEKSNPADGILEDFENKWGEKINIPARNDPWTSKPNDNDNTTSPTLTPEQETNLQKWQAINRSS